MSGGKTEFIEFLASKDNRLRVHEEGCSICGPAEVFAELTGIPAKGLTKYTEESADAAAASTGDGTLLHFSGNSTNVLCVDALRREWRRKGDAS